MDNPIIRVFSGIRSKEAQMNCTPPSWEPRHSQPLPTQYLPQGAQGGITQTVLIITATRTVVLLTDCLQDLRPFLLAALPSTVTWGTILYRKTRNIRRGEDKVGDTERDRKFCKSTKNIHPYMYTSCTPVITWPASCLLITSIHYTSLKSNEEW